MPDSLWDKLSIAYLDKDGELPVFQKASDVPDVAEYLSSLDMDESIDVRKHEMREALRSEDRDTKIASLLRAARHDQPRLRSYLREAYTNGNMGVTTDLLRQGVEIDGSIVKMAVEKSDTNALGLFLDHGWDINKPMSDYDPPALSLVVCDTKLVDWFLAHGANPGEGCRMFNITPLSYAVESAPMPVVKRFLETGHALDKGELLHHAVRRSLPDYMEVIACLIEKGAQVNRIMCEDDPVAYSFQRMLGLGTALHEAARLGKLDVIRFLEAHGADLSIRDSLGDWPEDVARRCGHIVASTQMKILRSDLENNQRSTMMHL